jgi:hypothetical protein
VLSCELTHHVVENLISVATGWSTVATQVYVHQMFGRKNARRRVSRVLSRPRRTVGRAGMAIPLGRSSPSASCDRPERRREGSPGISTTEMPAAPTWSCSRWGFPCRHRCRQRGALLPHRFTLAARRVFPRQAGGVLSVALSLGSPPPGVTRHRTSVEPGLSSPRHRRRAAIRPSGTKRFGYRRRACQRGNELRVVGNLEPPGSAVPVRSIKTHGGPPARVGESRPALCRGSGLL